MKVTDKDRESARALARAFYDVESPEARDKAEEGIAYRLAAEREWALAEAVEELRARSRSSRGRGLRGGCERAATSTGRRARG